MDISNSVDRRNEILALIQANGRVYVNELADKFQVSQETIRRDLNKLEDYRLIKKIHGGAVSSQFKFEHEFNERAKIAEAEKRAIAEKAVTLLQPGDTVFVDFGSTTLEFARQLATIDQLTVITNSPLIANVCLENDSIDVVLIGGQFIDSKMACLGAIALNNIEAFFADYAIIGAGAVNVQTGVMDQNVNEAAIARKMIAQSRKCIVLADENKLRGHAMTLVAKWPEVDYLVTSDSGNALEGLIFPANVNVLVAQV
ncbi:DeoR/GlpR transcriptional regulator [Serratia marcescens]|uniref:DeoR/GlpR family DNA-binding transcription regulator n=3 Tax=Serratia TaxID=613 RepID=A0AAW6X7W1_9GAMM|nr:MULTISPECIES: DeoR/GlpR family DNA-binding transcription regulator [Serratia]AUY15014.1 DeoR/GlpR transcriptional regulator [Serratia sp. SSNIH1]AVU35484.1 DeoR/GlpR transcriptional regulator [Serratia marcescens]AVU40591.1 DeoR/GlpR transcriptional regulator [Serratia marcescens]EGT3597433.1 DeoR/GlpR transcriptional regulator [Serratia marcescens]EIU0886923.1 DeoR/GlpR transcriptional regulator [Serratia marcescens]